MDRRSPPVLPAPTGPHPVGRIALDLVDRDRNDPFARRPGTPRKLAVCVFYPARAGGSTPAPYLPGAWRATSWLWGLNAARATGHAVEGAPPAESGHGFPLVAFSPSANPPHLYAALLGELASHGFVVAGIAHTYEVIPLTAFAASPPRLFRPVSTGGALARSGSRPFEVDLRERSRVVGVKAADLEFVLRVVAQSAGERLPPVDQERTAVAGHSFGGGAAAEVCMRGGAAAGMAIDGGLWRKPGHVGASGPFLQIFGEHREYEVSPAEVGAWQAMFERADGGRSVQVRGASHPSFCDWPMLPLRSWSPARRVLGGVVGDRVHRAVSDTVLGFLGDTLGTGGVAGAGRAPEHTREAAPEALFGCAA